MSTFNFIRYKNTLCNCIEVILTNGDPISIVKKKDIPPIIKSAFLSGPIRPVIGTKSDNVITDVYIRNVVGIIRKTK